MNLLSNQLMNTQFSRYSTHTHRNIQQAKLKIFDTYYGFFVSLNSNVNFKRSEYLFLL